MLKAIFYNIIPALSIIFGSFSLTAPWFSNENTIYIGFDFFSTDYNLLYNFSFVTWVIGVIAIFFILREIGLISLSISVILSAIWLNMQIGNLINDVKLGIYSWGLSYIILLPTFIYLIYDLYRDIKEEEAI